MVARGADGVISTPLAALKSDAHDKTGNYCPKRHTDPVIDRLIAELADRHHGVVATWQLVALGLTHDEIGYRAQNALIAHDEDVVIPATATEKIHYEGELVVVIGKKAKHLDEANAMSCVFGYTIGNDVSERSWQKADRGLWRAKNADTFKPMGPWIETEADLDKMETIVKVNGKETGHFHTNDMIFGVVPFIVELTKYFTLWPGDVIWMGTDGASPDLKAGDLVEIEITGIGTLRNKFVAEKR